MFKKCILIVLLPVLVGLLIFVAIKIGLFRHTQGESVVKQQQPVYTESDIQTYVNELMPVVEKAAGRKFKSAPTIKLVTVSELCDVMDAEGSLYQDIIWPGLTHEQIRQQAYFTTRRFTSGCFARFGPKTKILYMVPENFRPLMKRGKIDKKYEREFLKLIVAHELVHVLQDQQVGLARLIKQIDNVDRKLAFEAFIEGQAVFIQGKVTQEVGLQKAGDDIFLRTLKTEDRSKTYANGLKFVEWQYKKGGNERIWEIFSSLPTKMSMITHPETYNSIVKSKIDLKSVLDGLENHFKNRSWIVKGNQELTETNIRKQLYGIKSAEIDKITCNYLQGQLTSINSPWDNKIEIITAVAIMKDNSSAHTLASLMYKLNYQLFKSMPQIIDLYEREFYFSKEGRLQEPEKRIFLAWKYKNNIVRQSTVWFTHGRIIFQFVAVNYDVSDDQIRTVGNGIIDRIRRINPSLIAS